MSTGRAEHIFKIKFVMILQTLLLCSCPLSAAIATIDATAGCLERFGQTQRLILQRTFNGTVLNEIPLASVELLATYTALKAAVNSTKIQMTPRFGEPVNNAAEPRKAGGGNQTPGGVEVILGSSPSPFTAKFLEQPQSKMKAIKKYNCEDGLSVILVNDKGQFGMLADDNTTPTKYRGIPIRSFYLADKVLAGYEGLDYNMLSFFFEPDWSDEFVVITPQFNPHTALL